MKKALCILCINPNVEQIQFYKNLKDIYDIYFVCDNVKNYSTESEDVRFITISDKDCIKNGFKNANTAVMAKTPIAWDKALFYFSTVNTSYNFVWFVEEDVLVPTVKTLPNIDSKYGSEDLLVKQNDDYETIPAWPHWKEANSKIEMKYRASMVCAVRVSDRLLRCIKDYANKYQTLFFIELLFNTLAYHNRLVIKTIPELSTITFNDKIEEINKKYVYHPCKDLNQQDSIHKSFILFR